MRYFCNLWLSAPLLLFGGWLAVAPVPAACEEADNHVWTSQLDVLWVSIHGNEIELATLDTVDISGPVPEVVYSERVRVPFDEGPVVRFTLERRLNNGWRLGGAMWFFDLTDADFYRDLNSDTAAGIAEFATSPALGTRRALEVGEGGTEYFSDNHFAAGALQLYAAKELVRKPARGLDLLFGLRFAHLRDAPQEILYDRYYTDPDAITGTVVTHHQGRLEADLMAGPEIGVEGRWRNGRHRFQGSLTQAVVWGRAEQSGEYFVMVNANRVQDSWFETTTTESIPITELRFNWTWDLTRRWSFGAGLFASVWWNAPVGPVGQTPHTEPILRQETISIVGPVGTLQFRFGAMN